MRQQFLSTSERVFERTGWWLGVACGLLLTVVVVAQCVLAITR